MPTVSRLLLLLALSGSISLSAALATDNTSAQALLDQATPLILDATNDKNKYIDAALCYADALGFYETSGDQDVVSHLQATLFWCRQQIDNDALARFQAERALEPEALESWNRVNSIIERPISTDQVHSYLARADNFSQANPLRMQLTAFIYFEIAQRFQGLPEALLADKRYKDALGRHKKNITKALISGREPLIIPAAAVASIAPIVKVPQPSAEALKGALDSIHELYKSQYTQTKNRTALIPTLIKQANDTEIDALSRYALLHEARELSVGAKDIVNIIQLCEQIGEFYADINVSADKKTYLRKISGQTVIPSLLTLLDMPNDPSANAIVGRWYAITVEECSLALPHLANGSDPSLGVIAKAELAPKTLATEHLAVADQWYELGKRTAAIKEPLWRHALSIYETVRPQLSSLQAALTDKRIAEIASYLPLGPDINYDKLSASQWEKLKGTTIIIDAARGHTDTGIVLRDGQQMRLVPHPTDTWRITNGKDITIDTTYKGQSMRNKYSIGELICVVGNGMEQQPGLIFGIGNLTIFPSTQKGKGIKASGSIRVKLLPVTK